MDVNRLDLEGVISQGLDEGMRENDLQAILSVGHQGYHTSTLYQELFQAIKDPHYVLFLSEGFTNSGLHFVQERL